MIYSLIILKRVIEDIFIWPFIILGKLKAISNPLLKNYDIFFFFPFYHTGGAEKIHSQIVHAISDRKALIIFTRKSVDSAFRKKFEEAGHDIMDISRFTDNKKRYWDNLIYRGVFSAHINSQRSPVLVFNGQSNFGYKLSPWVRRSITQLELIHSFSSFSYIRVPFLPFYKQSVMISKRRIEDHLHMYKRWGVPAQYKNRIRYIINGIELPAVRPQPKTAPAFLKLMYVGRGTVEKRPVLAAYIVNSLRDRGIGMEMSYVGDVADVIPEPLKGKDQFYGTINDPRVLDELYREKADILLVTSSEEGFPLVVMEAMARGVVIIGTPVGDMPVHIQQGVNGFLFSEVFDETKIVQEAEQFILRLMNEPELFKTMSAANIEYAYKNFGLANFEQEYQELIETNFH